MKPAEEFQRVTERVCFWEAYDPAVKTELSCSAVRAAEGLVLIDPIRLAAEALEELGAPAFIVVTSANHWRAARWYAERFSVPVLAHAKAWAACDLASFPGGEPDRLIQGGDVLAGDLEVHEVAGAAAGEVALLHPSGSLHFGDALIHVEPYGFALLPEKYCEDAAQMRNSLQKLLHLEFTVLLFAHGTPLVSDARGRLAQLLS